MEFGFPNADPSFIIRDYAVLTWNPSEGAMSRKCQLTGKRANNAYAVSHSHRRTKKLQGVNLQKKRVWWPQGNRWVTLRLSTTAIKTLNNKGLAAMAKEAGINLNKL